MFKLIALMIPLLAGQPVTDKIERYPYRGDAFKTVEECDATFADHKAALVQYLEAVRGEKEGEEFRLTHECAKDE